MTLRKPAYAAGAHGSGSPPPHPATPRSPTKPVLQASGNGPLSRRASSISYDDNSQSQREGFLRTNSTSPEDSDSSQLPSLLGNNALEVDAYSSHSNDLPLSLHIPRPHATPSSSLESQEFPIPSSSGIAEINTHRPPQSPANARSNSNNPFLRNAGNGLLSQANQSSERSSTEVWADEESTLSSSSHVEKNPRSPSPLGSPTANNGYSSTCPMPFEEPCMSTKVDTVSERPCYTGSGMGENPDWASEMSEAWYEQPRGASQNLQQRRTALPNVPNSAHNGSQELESPWQGVKSSGVRSRAEKGASDDPGYLPPLPPRNDEVSPSLTAPAKSLHIPDPAPRPPQTQIDTSVNNGTTTSPPPRSELDEGKNKKQRSETYQIKLVNWFDALSHINPRRSPIMVQNANGPCPLLALVNALVLSTPAGQETALLDTLERREQVSLGLLLDAVIDELMSGRRGDAAQNLPDVSDLYAFLVNLHTGMNVNPRFITPEPQSLNLMDAPIRESHANSNTTGARFAGGFEDTREMRLYSTFAVPLIHGWIPPRNHPAFAALERSAKTYEDAQNLLFAEEELEDKLQSRGLNSDEQLLLEDIASIKYFLSSSATQLTGYGLDSMTESLSPGQIAILFRNDHFSTLYRHPRSGQLFTLVTDMGYAGHDEVVWESLVDVSGEGCEFFAGDFRPVGNIQPQSARSPYGGDAGWTTATRSSGSRRSKTASIGRQVDTGGPSGDEDPAAGVSALSLQDPENPKSPNTEQEDHDLALALQLQEEEEERERQEIAARKRENELSQAFLESQPAVRGRNVNGRSEPRPSVPPRSNHPRAAGLRNGRGSQVIGAGETARNSRTRPARTDESEEAPPPTYEQAAKGPAYHPPPNHPPPANASNTSAGSKSRPPGRQRLSSAYSQHSTAALAESSPIASSPGKSPFSYPPALASQSRRPGSFRDGAPGRGGLGGVEGVSGVHRRNDNPSLATDEAGKKGDCIIM